MLKSSLCDYRDAYILVNETTRVPNIVTAWNLNNRKNKIIINCPPFTNCISEINNTQIYNAKDTDVAMSMNYSKEYSNNY